MRPWRLGLIIVVAIALQASFLPAWRPFGVVPDALLAALIALALWATASEMLLVAIVVGLFLDLASGVDFGLRLGFYTAVALAVSLVGQAGVALDTLPWRLGLVATFYLIYQAIILLGLALSGVTVTLGAVWVRLTTGVIMELLVMVVVGIAVDRLRTAGDGGSATGRR